jgi:hypothetical protein
MSFNPAPERPVITAIGFDRTGTAIEVSYDIEKRAVLHAMPIRKF